MATVKLLLRAPPNVEFVSGYPGISGDSNVGRPPAMVKGSIEVRAGGQGVKAKWVHIELRKVETLPGGGPAGTFFDFVGGNPTSLWQAGDDYGILQNSDLPFEIRIPESIPPSISLEKGAGIRYDLIASVCVKGKGSWFRRAKPVVTTTTAAVLIDKHEIHSTWPIYCQPEMRRIEQNDNGVALTVERNQTCYGPGSRVSVVATLRTDDLHTVILRGFELTLRETTVFRAGTQGKGKATGPQVSTRTVGEQKVPVNATLYGGSQKRAELTCQIPADHTTTSLSAARHIDITYTVSVKALMGTGAHVLMDMPVIISNWPRAVSVEAVKRIGAVPNLSLGLPTAPAEEPPAPTPVPQSSYPQQSLPSASTEGGYKSFNPKPYNTVPNGGYADGPMSATSKVDEFGGYGGGLGYGAGSSSQKPSQSAQGSSSANGSAYPAPGSSWPTSDDEKQRLYNTARQKVEMVQGNAIRGPSPEPVATPPRTTSPPIPRTHWPTAEDEKTRLFSDAQARAQRTQAAGTSLGSPHSRNNSYEAGGSSRPGGSSSRYRPGVNGDRSASPPVQMPTPMPVPQYPSADQEKAALRAYEAAKGAVDRNQGGGSGSSSTPVAYDALYPGASSSSAQPQYLSEKQRLQRDFDAREAAASTPARTPTSAYPQTPSYTPSYAQNTPMSATSGSQIVNEKEMLRRKYEAEEAQSRGGVGSPREAPKKLTPSPPPRRAAGGALPPPTGGNNILSAIDEKALLAARYKAEDAQAQAGSSASRSPSYGASSLRSPAYTNGNGSESSSPPAPPPLLPRPPAEYIRETRDEDIRLSRAVSASASPSDLLENTPFTPFANGFEGRGNVPPPPPPLPQ